ncbi:MAG: M1 family metallopeptidase [bacterium]|nr:M1 family metallopeptidase [bacterium]
MGRIVQRMGLGLAVALAFVFGQPVTAQTAGAPGIGDSYYPGFGNGGYDVAHYALEMAVDPAANFLEAQATIRALALEPLSSFNLDLIGLDVTSITVNDQPAAFTRDGQELTITPAEPLAEGETFTASVAYNGTPEPVTSVALPVRTGWVPYTPSGTSPSGAAVFVMSEPDGAATFFPCNDHPLDKATYTFSVTVPEPYRVAMNGLVRSVTDHGDSTTTVSDVNHPMASYLVTINIAQFERADEPGSHGVPIRNYFEKGISPDVRALFARQDEMMGYFESLFGEYPFDVYGAVVVNTEPGSALETQTLSIFGLDTVSERDPFESELIIAHELAHQWYGNSVSLADWRDIWLNEGWATFAEGLWIEYSDGDAAYQAYVTGLYDYLVRFEIEPPGSPAPDDLFNQSVYFRGAMTLHALRARLGDDTFFEIARAWAAQYAYGNATTADFIALAETISGEPLDDFFDGWLYDARVPAL